MDHTDGALCSWTIPQVGGGSLEIEAIPGRVTTFVGANGAGKSALGYWLQANCGVAASRRLLAHRQLWLQHAGSTLSAGQRTQTAQNLRSYEAQADSRWMDHGAAQRPNLALFDLLAKLNERNARVADLVDTGTPLDEVRAQVEPSILSRMNRLMDEAGLGVRFRLADDGSFEVTGGDFVYPVSRMSDGEKSAMLLCAEVLLAETSSVLIIDEPERHIHRSISAPLVESLVRERSDCHFVLLTHDLELAAALRPPSATAVVVRSCQWEGETAVAWDLFLLEANEGVPDDVRTAVLGGRHQVVFLEGVASSLDFRLLSAVYPGATFAPIGGCEEVIRAVKGLRTSGSLHWVDGRGLVDGDRRSPEEESSLREAGIAVLGALEIESLYLLDQVMDAVAAAHGEDLGLDPAALIAKARSAALEALQNDGIIGHLSRSVALAAVQRQFRDAVNHADLGEATISVTIESPAAAEEAELRALIAAGDLEKIVRRYPIRDTPAPQRVARALRFASLDDYQRRVRQLAMREKPLADLLREFIGLPATE